AMRASGWQTREYTSDIPQNAKQPVSGEQNFKSLTNYDPIARAGSIYQDITHRSSEDCMCLVGYSRGGGLAILVAETAFALTISHSSHSIRPQLLVTVDPILFGPSSPGDPTRGCAQAMTMPHVFH